MKTEDLLEYIQASKSAETSKEPRMLSIRPPLDYISKLTSGAFLSCTCGDTVQTYEGLVYHWSKGCFDIMVVEEEYLDLLAKAGVKIKP